MTRQHPVVIVGAGISGLTTAYWLRQAGVEVLVLEKADAVGGTMRTTREDGWLIETGPNSALETTPVLAKMFAGLGLEEEKTNADPASNRRYILRGGTLHALPMSPQAFFSSSLWSLPGKLRLLKEPFIGRASREESVAEFVTRRLGREFLDYAINPFVAGVFAGNPEELSVRSAFPKLYALEERYGGLIRGMIGGARERKRRAEKAKDRAMMFSFLSGMETFPRALAQHLGAQVRTGVFVAAVDVRPPGPAGSGAFDVTVRRDGRAETITASAVVISVPAFAAALILRGISPGLAGALEGVFYPPVTQVFLGYKDHDCGRALDGFGFLVPALERRSILGTIWSSALFAGRAPAGHVALTTFVGGSRSPALAELDDGELLSRVTHDLGTIMNVRGKAVITRITRWPRAIPQYRLGYRAVDDALDAFELAHPGMFICSNFRGGIAVGDCVANGEKTATRVAAYCRTPRG